ncbi:MAG: glycosyltransferase family 39 protein, partial [Elusimicrobiota bacterium]|nr:glycosyltransferase family 39 protein [Elusimicrobiota bacterium]
MKVELFPVILLLIVHFYLGIETMKYNSQTYDEAVHLSSGYSYWKTGEYRLNIRDHPPVAKLLTAIPLLFIRPILPVHHPAYQQNMQYLFGDVFLYYNKISAEKLLNYGRVPILFLSCMLAIGIYLWTKKLYGVVSGLMSLMFYCLSSNIIAHSTLVTTDIPLTCFYFFGIYTFYCWLKKPNFLNNFFCALTTAFALCTKFSAVIILFVYLVIFILKFKKIQLRKIITHLVLFFVIVYLTMSFIYQLDIGLYFDGLKYIIGEINRGRSVFLVNKYSTQGFIYYFLLTVLLKTPVIFILILICSFVFQKKNSLANAFLLSAVVIYFAFASFSKLQLGLRHILPVYPFLFVFTGNFTKFTVDRLKSLWLKVIFF